MVFKAHFTGESVWLNLKSLITIQQNIAQSTHYSYSD